MSEGRPDAPDGAMPPDIQRPPIFEGVQSVDDMPVRPGPDVISPIDPNAPMPTARQELTIQDILPPDLAAPEAVDPAATVDAVEPIAEQAAPPADAPAPGSRAESTPAPANPENTGEIKPMNYTAEQAAMNGLESGIHQKNRGFFRNLRAKRAFKKAAKFNAKDKQDPNEVSFNGYGNMSEHYRAKAEKFTEKGNKILDKYTNDPALKEKVKQKAGFDENALHRNRQLALEKQAAEQAARSIDDQTPAPEPTPEPKPASVSTAEDGSGLQSWMNGSVEQEWLGPEDQASGEKPTMHEDSKFGQTLDRAQELVNDTSRNAELRDRLRLARQERYVLSQKGSLNDMERARLGELETEIDEAITDFMRKSVIDAVNDKYGLDSVIAQGDELRRTAERAAMKHAEAKMMPTDTDQQEYERARALIAAHEHKEATHGALNEFRKKYERDKAMGEAVDKKELSDITAQERLDSVYSQPNTYVPLEMQDMVQDTSNRDVRTEYVSKVLGDQEAAVKHALAATEALPADLKANQQQALKDQLEDIQILQRIINGEPNKNSQNYRQLYNLAVQLNPDEAASAQAQYDKLIADRQAAA